MHVTTVPVTVRFLSGGCSCSDFPAPRWCSVPERSHGRPHQQDEAHATREGSISTRKSALKPYRPGENSDFITVSRVGRWPRYSASLCSVSAPVRWGRTHCLTRGLRTCITGFLSVASESSEHAAPGGAPARSGGEHHALTHSHEMPRRQALSPSAFPHRLSWPLCCYCRFLVCRRPCSVTYHWVAALVQFTKLQSVTKALCPGRPGSARSWSRREQDCRHRSSGSPSPSAQPHVGGGNGPPSLAQLLENLTGSSYRSVCLKA